MPKCEKCNHFYSGYLSDANLKGFSLESSEVPTGKERPPLLTYCSIKQCPRCNPAGEIMKLTEAIKHAEETVLDCAQYDNPELAEYTDQLARWLIELRAIKDEHIKDRLGE